MTENANKKKTYSEFSFTKLFADMIKGGFVGSFSITMVTPFKNLNNHVLAAQGHSSNIFISILKNFNLRRAFDGVLSYNASVVPMTSVSLPLNAFLLRQANLQDITPNQLIKIQFAIFSGMIAGIVGTPPEGVAQVQQLNTPKPQTITIITDVIKHNGIFALGRGTTATMMRQGLFTGGFIGLMPYITDRIHKKINHSLIADLVSAILCGFIVGPITTPWNALRFEKQKNFNIPGYPESYLSIIKEKNLMRGYQPRTLMAIGSMFFLHKGKEVYDKLSDANETLVKR